MSKARRPIALCLFVLVLAVFWFVPRIFNFGTTQLQVWATLGQIGGPLVAAMLCFRVARASSGADRTAWFSFAVGSSLYVFGNLFYVYYALVGAVPAFPALTEVTYFAMAGFFAAGMYFYGNVRGRVSHVQFYNFVLFYCAITLATLFLLHGHIVDSVMAPFATAVAFLYPALWFSVGTFGLITMFLYDSGDRAQAFALLILAVFAEASADMIYALDLMRGSFQIGGITQFLWVASAGLIAWAAFERLHPSKSGGAAAGTLFRRIDSRAFVQAVTPAVALALVLLPGVHSGALGDRLYLGLASGLAVVFAIGAGLRENWIIRDQGRLRREREKASAGLAKSQQRLTSVLESTGDSVVVLDRDWRIEYFNQRVLAVSPRLSSSVIGAPFWESLPGGESHPVAAHLGRAVASQAPVEFEVEIESTGAWFAVGAYPSPDGLSIFFRDISESRRVREEIAYLAHHDPLTGLVNRSLFRERLTAGAESGAQVAVLLLDLDHFKEINDTFGHPAGDSLLVAIAGRLRQCLRLDDTIARLGGDEFAVLLVNHAGPVEVARLARRIITAVSAPHSVSGQSMHVGASLGIAFSDEDNADPDRIFKKADIALYAAKAEATGEFRFFEAVMEIAVQERQALRADLRTALDNDEFELFYQPLFDFRLNRVCGFEALLRWRHPTRGMISPEIFIPIAEDTGLIMALGDWVFETACAEAARWPENISVAINLSTRQFSNGDLAHKVEASLRRTKFDRARLELEITESVLLKDSSANLVTLRRLRELGIRIALDDFGTGYSSLGYLQKFPFSKIKIDRSFVSGLPQNEESQAIVRAVIGLGQALGMRVTAEGVETQEQFDWIKSGCDEAQGYFLSRPVPGREVPGLLKSLAEKLPARRQLSRLAG